MSTPARIGMKTITLKTGNGINHLKKKCVERCALCGIADVPGAPS
jgi:hypothetical protein